MKTTWRHGNKYRTQNGDGQKENNNKKNYSKVVCRGRGKRVKQTKIQDFSM